MSAIGPIAGALPAANIGIVPDVGSTGTGAAGGSGGSGGGFGKALTNAVNNLNDQLNNASDQAQQLATGQSSDLTGVVMATEQASVELEVASAIRNQAVNAYRDIFQMQV